MVKSIEIPDEPKENTTHTGPSADQQYMEDPARIDTTLQIPNGPVVEGGDTSVTDGT